MLKKLRVGMMPPAGKPRPDFATVQAFVDSLETKIDAHEKPSLRVPKLHRLNRAEYANAVRDLLALDIDSTQVPAGGRFEPRLRQPGGRADAVVRAARGVPFGGGARQPRRDGRRPPRRRR